MKKRRLVITLALGLSLALALLWILGSLSSSAVAAPSVGHVEAPKAPAAELHVCPAGPPTCDYSSVQTAVDAANSGDLIKVASGIYTGVSARESVTQVVYISKTVTVQGGYTTSNWTISRPQANPTTLDAQEQGRVLYIIGNISPTVEGLRITGGYVKASGGGIYNKGADLALVNTIITNNISSGTNWPDGLGGGVSVWGGSVTLNGGQVISNSATYKGGGVSVWGGSVTLNGGQIINNIANGPTYWDGGGGVWVLGSATLIGGQIISNSAIHGGGLYVYLSNVTLREVQIIDNSAASSGGGVFIWPGSVVTLNGGGISNNSARSCGGVAGGGTFTLTNSVVSDNRAEGSGSGLCISGDSSRLLHTTIARNFGGDGSGIHATGSAAVAMTNTILVSHTVGITVTAGSTATLNGVLWYNNTVNTGGTGTIAVTNQHTGALAFADDGYHLTASSAAIDKGVDAGVTVDIDGEPRPAGTGYDLGADELWHKIYLPLISKPKVCSSDTIVDIGETPCAYLLAENLADGDQVTWDLYRYHDDNNDGDLTNDVDASGSDISVFLDAHGHIGGYFVMKATITHVDGSMDVQIKTIELIPTKARVMQEMRYGSLTGEYIDDLWAPGNITTRIQRFNSLVGKGPSVGFSYIGWEVDLQLAHMQEIIQNGSIPWFNWDALFWPTKQFTVGLEFQSDLEQGILSEGFRQEFEDHGISLSETITISTTVEGNKWQIDDIDQGQMYIVIKADGILNIHSGWIDLQEIIDGQYDDFIRQNMTILSEAKYPIVISFNHELDGPWVPNAFGEPEKYRQAYEHIMDMAPDNIIWVFGSNDQSWDPNNLTDKYYPQGNPQGIDLYAPSVYNWGNANPDSGWRDPMEMLDSVANDHARIDPDVLFGLAEFGCTDEGPGNKIEWIGKFPEAAQHYRLAIINLFDADKETGWSLTTPPGFEDAYRQAIGEDPFFRGFLLYPSLSAATGH